MSDPNLNDAVEPTAGAFESAEDELDIVEAADAEEPDQAEAADAAAGEPAEQAALHVEDEDEEEAAEADAESESDEDDEEEAEPPSPSTPSPPCATSCAAFPASGTSSTRTPVTRSA